MNKTREDNHRENNQRDQITRGQKINPVERRRRVGTTREAAHSPLRLRAPSRRGKRSTRRGSARRSHSC